MNIEITADEYRDLLDILHIADLIVSGHRREPDKRSERHRALIQKIYGLAQGEGLDRLMRHDAPDNVYVPTPEFEESTLSHVLVNEFADHVFWDELISRLVRAGRGAGRGRDGPTQRFERKRPPGNRRAHP